MSSVMIDRRRFLILTGGLAAGSQLLPTWPERADAADLDPAPFPLGLASGDPDHCSVVLWTRLANDPLVPGGGLPATPVTVGWELARDPGFRHVLARGSTVARPEDAHAVHVTARGLPPDRWFHYRFHALGQTSRTGRTRTMPAPGRLPDEFRLAVASCQSWAGGPYPAYRDLAEHDVDLVLHLGDYIYETSNGSLDEFRRLHALYKTSPQLREAHARAPFVTT
jgi:phosphodiesterase/alkaline phosphatase D-like protein